ncbi:MAG TPA: TusE/DsrC/DsvC family sulfur relay protein [Gammaproteobacteria bacterium]|nr:TusE/DsrC/DsvC family sulfur relay protein [Gammaproteobacteria bacterium]
MLVAVQFNVNGKMVETNEQGFLRNLDDWSEEFAAMLAEHDGIELYVDHWELIWYFRDYYAETQSNPTMRMMILTLGKHRGGGFRNKKAYEKHIYSLFPKDPIHELCKLAGLPMPQPDS